LDIQYQDNQVESLDPTYDLVAMKNTLSSLKTLAGSPSDFPLSDTDVKLENNKVKLLLT
jgi:hypothetical protein